LVVAARRARKWRSAAARIVQTHTTAASVEDGIAALALEMLEGRPCPPTPLEELCGAWGISVAKSDELMGSGALVKDGDTFQVLYAGDLSLQRRRFTIAHELGHFALERAGGTAVPQSKELERLCDLFATELLMPKSVFLRAVDEDFHLSSLPRLAQLFKVSLTSAAIRLAELTKISIFEADEERVWWGVGLVKRGPLKTVDDTLRPAIATAVSGHGGTQQVYLTMNDSVLRCLVEYWPIGKTGRTLVLLRRLPIR
jgi:hypothetical protein